MPPKKEVPFSGSKKKEVPFFGPKKKRSSFSLDSQPTGDMFVSDHTDGKGQSSGTANKDKNPSIYQNEPMEPCNYSSSIHYGGQENYSPRKKSTEPPHYVSIYIYNTTFTIVTPPPRARDMISDGFTKVQAP